MAKKNGRDDPPKPQVAENEQMSDIILILDKMELILQAVSQIDKDGRYKTVPADKEHTNSFLKIDRYASMFENFLKNFWSQLKDPTRFGILSVKEKALDDPKVRQAIEDLAAGKKTDAVEEFLKQYEIVPRDKENQSINHQNQEEMAKENETQQQADQGGGTPCRHSRTASPSVQLVVRSIVPYLARMDKSARQKKIGAAWEGRFHAALGWLLFSNAVFFRDGGFRLRVCTVVISPAKIRLV